MLLEGVMECLAVGRNDDSIVEGMCKVGRACFGSNLLFVGKQIDHFIGWLVTEQVSSR